MTIFLLNSLFFPVSSECRHGDGFASDWLISQAVQSPGCIFPRTGERAHSRGLSWWAPVSGQQLPAFLSSGHGFRAPVCARLFPISVSGEGRLVRLLPEVSSRNSPRVIVRDADMGPAAVSSFVKELLWLSRPGIAVKPLAGSHSSHCAQ